MSKLKVLLVVDLQRDFCPGGSLAVEDGDGIIPTVAGLIRSGYYDLIVASKDWHPANHASFASNHPGEKVFADILLPDGTPQRLWPDHCVQGSQGADFHPGIRKLLELCTHKIVDKGKNPAVDSYSAFFDNNKLQETELRGYLAQASFKKGGTLKDVEVDVCGLAFDYCVAATAIDAAELGIKTNVLLDATRAVDQKNVRSVYEKLKVAGVTVLPGREVGVARAQEISLGA